MAKAIGIDLGTTNSCVAVKVEGGDIRLGLNIHDMVSILTGPKCRR
jgi:molecular chaperone DnaK (HSP70)